MNDDLAHKDAESLLEVREKNEIVCLCTVKPAAKFSVDKNLINWPT